MISWIRSALAPAMLPVALSAGMLVTACGPGSGAAKDSAAAIQAEAGSAAAIQAEEGSTAAAWAEEGSTAAARAEEGSTAAAWAEEGSAAAARAEAGITDGNHGMEVNGGEDGTKRDHEDLGTSEAGEEAGIIIGLPQNENWCKDPVFSTEEGNVVQVMFHDGMTDSDVILRASREEDGDPSVFYYLFDDNRKVTWTARAEDGTEITVTVEVTIENSDIRGVLATWKYNGTLFALWEDDAVDQVDSVAKLAAEIAGRSR
ncbi:MAG: hypothetical protein E7244_01590 [Enterocloster citroniae]|nr:hypothetical protein [Enterocloster citroniae]